MHCFAMYPKCTMIVLCVDRYFQIYILILFCGFIISFMRTIFVTFYIYFCINPYVIFVFNIHSLRMNPDHYLRAPRLPRFPVIETFEDMPALYLLYYNEPPLPYATPTPGIVVQDLRTLVGLPIHNLPLSIVNTSFPLDEIVLASTVMDWLRANANFATMATFSQTKFDSMIFMPPTHMALMARRQALRRVFVILRNQALSEYNPN
jgi:hypothetical protein